MDPLRDYGRREPVSLMTETPGAPFNVAPRWDGGQRCWVVAQFAVQKAIAGTHHQASIPGMFRALGWRPSLFAYEWVHP